VAAAGRRPGRRGYGPPGGSMSDTAVRDVQTLEPACLPAKQAARYLGMPVEVLAALVDSGELPAIEIGDRRIFRRIDLDAWVSKAALRAQERARVRAEEIGRRKAHQMCKSTQIGANGCKALQQSLSGSQHENGRIRSVSRLDPSGVASDDGTRGALMRVPEAAVYLSVSVRTLYELLRDGEIPFIKARGTTLIPREALDRWIRERLAARPRLLHRGRGYRPTRRVSAR
jgi:excisionase family DNA binding protein